ncbi:hypothetical protein HPB52_019591 [Rhipicephalus sanguineus]|uniref:Uncharacterized protein n=1 Tax=Rhipicephalus sanguineus TaxID=34632 RepID=A0A9D4Q870_RHISA|nr:hypothetical protein HPB52_019591 [Rhipicephalus sanguineus]
MADYYGSIADFGNSAGPVEESTQNEVYRYAPPLRPVLTGRQDSTETYNDAVFLPRYLFLMRPVLRLLETLPLGTDVDGRE